MKTKSNSLYYIIEGEPYLSVAKAFVNEYQAAHKRVCDYLDGLGVSQWRYGFSGHIAGVVFEGNIPPDFCKPDNYGVTRPKKTSKYYKEFKRDDLKLPDVEKWILDKFYIPTGYGYKYDGGSGGTAIGHPFKPIEICWYSTDDNAPLMLKIPNIPYEIEYKKATRSNVVFENDFDKWKLDETGLRQILVEEWDLMVAKYKAEKDKINIDNYNNN